MKDQLNDKEIIEKVNERLWGSHYYQDLENSVWYFCKVLVRYTRWLERAKWEKIADALGVAYVKEKYLRRV